uniref:Bm1363, isoform f n=1 Tax=Brugia malayi TaxID=6279 RepID=A0A1I9G2Z4_BRUMA|nr:Bm1363, isoform f [Brugia malayi]
MLAGLLFLDKRTTIDLGLFGRAPICGLIKNASLDRNTNRIHGSGHKRENGFGEKDNTQFYYTLYTGQHDAIRVGFMINRNYEMMTQNRTFYDMLDGIYVKMHPTEPCSNICCVIMKLVRTNEVELEQASCDQTLINNNKNL